jgi:hypothetical protein
MTATLAVLNLDRPGLQGWQVAEKARVELSSWAGGWARQPGIADHLVGKPQPRVLPSNESGQDLAELLQKLRTQGTPSSSSLWQIGRLLGVDYLLVLKVRKSRVSARLFSVHRQRWAPQGYERAGHQVAPLKRYVLAQAGVKRGKRRGKKASGSWWARKWWVWAVAGALAAVTIGFALSDSDDSAGTLRIRVKR